MGELVRTQTAFIGRSREIDEISALLDNPSCRLLTLVGPGGIGKTRLAMEVAARMQSAFPDGIFLVPLAPLNSADDMLTAIIEAMPFRLQQDDRDPYDQFAGYLHEKRAKQMLLVLDNLEHLLDGVDLISRMLAATENLKVLVTSREALNLQEEWVRQVDGLTYPVERNGKPLEEYSAVRLFLDRARQIRGDFKLADDQDSVLEICRLVDGMPLAIELAAGWLNTLQPAEIVREIQRNIDILATRARNLPERHRNIRSVFSHSWRLIADDERDVFKRLAFFRGGFTREAAEVVAGATLHTLAGLVDKSLVRLGASGRYDVHELLRQYGMEQLDAAQTAQVESAYIDYYLGMLGALENGIKAHHQPASLDIIAAEFENVRYAWLLAVEQGHFPALNQAVESLHFYADMRGRYHEVITLLRTALERFPTAPSAEQTAIRDRIQSRLTRLIILSTMRIDFDIRAQIDSLVAAARQRGDRPELAFCLLVSGIIAVWENDKNHTLNEMPESYFRESFELYSAEEDLFYVAEALVWLGMCTEIDWDDPYEQCMTLRREIDDRNGIAWLTMNHATYQLGELNFVDAEHSAEHALSFMREIGSLKGILQCLYLLAQFRIMKGELEEALTLVEEIRALADETNNLDGKMLSAGSLSFLVSIMHENYTDGAALAQKNYSLSLEPFFGWNFLVALWGQAVVACGLGQFDAVRREYDKVVWDRLEDPATAALCLALEAAALTHDGDVVRAAELLGLAFSLPPWANGWLHRWALLDRVRADLTGRLGEPAFGAAWERGCMLDLETTMRALVDGVDDTDALQRAAAHPDMIEPLSDREREVLGLIVDGLSNRDIAERLVLSVGTVKVHARNIYGKLNVNSRTQAIAQAARYNLL